MKNVFAFLFGALFSVGLMVSGMSNPERYSTFWICLVIGMPVWPL